MAVFTWTADFGATKTKKPRVNEIGFGDGYSQRVAHGLNTMPENWNLKFGARAETEADEIEDFLIARAGVELFDWTPPGAEDALKFLCKEWTRTIDNGSYYTITAIFEQRYEP